MTTLLNGRLQLPPHAPHPAEDALWLAASVPPLPAGTPVLDAACGIGTAGFALALRQPHIQLTGLDVDPTLTAFATQTAALNSIPFTALTADVLTTPLPQRYPVILCNPPFYKAETHTPATKPTKQTAHHLPAGHLTHWLKALTQALTPTGTLHLILHTACLPELLAFAQTTPAALTTTPLQTAATRPPKRFLATLTPSTSFSHTLNPAIPTYTPTLRTAVLRNLSTLPTPKSSV